ncbi:MAG: nuclease A inhibitor family protein [Candidatus Kapaibacterium sp.]
MMTTDELIDELRRLSTGLLYPSESDAPIDVYVWRTAEQGAMTLDNIAFHLHHPEDVLVSESEAAEFFEGVTDVYEWHSAEEVEETKQFQQLRDVFFSSVTKPLQVWFGENKVDVLVLGRTSQGDYVGLRTFIVET